MNEEIEQKLISAIDKNWKTAEMIKAELGLDNSNKSIGKLLSHIKDYQPGIMTKKRANVSYYRLSNGVAPPIPAEIIVNEDQIQKLKNELMGYGLDISEIQEVMYKALITLKESVVSELQLVEAQAPTFKRQFDGLKTQLHDLKNQLDDMKDSVRNIEKRNIQKSILDERKLTKEA